MKPDWDKLMTEFDGHKSTVIADVDCTAEGKPLCDKEGVKGFPTIKHGDVAALLEITEGKGAALIVEMLGDANLGVDCAMVAQGGTVAVVGNRGAATINARELMMREASIVGVMLARSSAEEAKAALAALGAGLADGTLRPVVGPVFPLARAAEAHIDVLEHRGGASGKVVIQTWSEEAAVAE